ncbi:hypothetical protein [uncultured Nostoc sp.]|uniref:hypothetical protein n=1 Tax=uncultured Nostoc sp. TaxID=340711 RepID=UPI0035CB5F47
MSKIATCIRFINAIIASDRAWSSFPERVCKQYWYSRPKNPGLTQRAQVMVQLRHGERLTTKL